MYDRERYNLSEGARYIGNKKIGRQKLYMILKELGIVDSNNKPVQKYIDQGYLAVGLPYLDFYECEVPVTLVVGQRGLDFVKQTVEDYLKDHPIPKVIRRTRPDHGINI